MDNTISKLESKLKQYENELNELLNDETMRDACFTSVGCGNSSTQKKLTAYRNKIGVHGDKIRAIKLALKIINRESFTHRDIINIYDDFLQLRNPELRIDVYYSEVLTFDLIKQVIGTIINVFLPICKNKVLNMGLVFSTRGTNTVTIPLK